ncbi:hypothetical protein CVT24_012871 [Panaeolus cyanescens]|uniref:HTH cro/C1-type domain-containing protein n=1 Tax=Panaeolus cyanescens TaxID=181874 RepID=A0A409WR29_9AGAR|nr:hypothetical protein CVT24_012871 [Panaeolus cyanescens]
MAPSDPRCTAVAAAKAKSGLSYAQIASKIGKTEQEVTDICTGASRPNDADFKALADALGITGPLPTDANHKA